MSIVSYYTTLNSPVGTIVLTASAVGITGCTIDTPVRKNPRLGEHLPTQPYLEQAARECREYFAGERRVFTVPLAPLNGTAFQERVWQALSVIPYGTTLSYAELAARIGAPRAVRAVGSANGKNPVSIIIPCHRVIASGGGIGGYGWGVEIKKQLLLLEKAQPFYSFAS